LIIDASHSKYLVRLKHNRKHHQTKLETINLIDASLFQYCGRCNKFAAHHTLH
jgi:hypothetical protein